MMINKIGQVSKLFKINKGLHNNRANGKDESFRLTLSEEAKKLAEIAKYQEIVRNTPNIRADKVREVQQKIEAGNYFNTVSAEMVAQKIIDHYVVPPKH